MTWRMCANLACGVVDVNKGSPGDFMGVDNDDDDDDDDDDNDDDDDDDDDDANDKDLKVWHSRQWIL